MFNRNAQIAIYDVLFAVFIFVVVFAGLSTVHNQNFITGTEVNKLNEMRHLAHNAIKILVDFEGTPSNWDSSNVIVPGLKEKKGVLSEEKVSELNKMSYEDLMEKLVFGRYNFLLEIDSKNDAHDLNIGQELNDTGIIVKVEKKAMYKGEIANVKLSLFE